MRHSIITVALSLSLGMCIGAAIMVVVTLAMREHAEGLAEIPPFELHFLVQDANNIPVSGADLVLVNSSDGDFWRDIGNWHGPGSLVTDGDGKVVFTLTEGYAYGGHAWRIWGYQRNEMPQPKLELRYRGYAIAGMPLTSGVKKAMIEVICDTSALPGGQANQK